MTELEATFNNEWELCSWCLLYFVLSMSKLENTIKRSLQKVSAAVETL